MFKSLLNHQHLKWENTQKWLGSIPKLVNNTHSDNTWYTFLNCVVFLMWIVLIINIRENELSSSFQPFSWSCNWFAHSVDHAGRAPWSHTPNGDNTKSKTVNTRENCKHRVETDPKWSLNSSECVILAHQLTDEECWDYTEEMFYGSSQCVQ